MSRLRGLFLLDPLTCDLVYGPDARQAIARHVDILAVPQTHDSLAKNPDLASDAQVIFSGWGGPVLDEHFFDLAPDVSAIFHAGGTPRLPANAVRRGVVLTSAHLANSIPVAEYTLATIIFSLKHAWHLMHQTRTLKTFPERNGAPGCYQKSVGLIGLGMVSRLLLPLLKPLDLRVLAYDPHITPAQAAEMGAEWASLDDVMSRSDVVSLHAPHLADTEGMITGERLASMKPGATFINTARGVLVREQELIEVARSRTDLQFVLDVTDPEPPVAGSPLYTLPNVVLTPHIAGSAGGECRRMGDYLVEELERFVAGQPLRWAAPNAVLPGRPVPSLHVNGAAPVRPRVTIAGKLSLQHRANGPQVESLHAQ